MTQSKYTIKLIKSQSYAVVVKVYVMADEYALPASSPDGAMAKLKVTSVPKGRLLLSWAPEVYIVAGAVLKGYQLTVWVRLPSDLAPVVLLNGWAI